MRALTTTAVVGPDHTLTLPVPPDIPPGVHEVVVVLQEAAPRPRPGLTFADWPAQNVGPWPENLSLRREDLYGDDGR
jgi:hypothetical protein